MPALYSHTTRAIGTTLTATIYNADHQNHITNGVPSQLDDYSASVAEMQTETDPGELGSESQAGSLAGEIERLRFAIKEIKQTLDVNITQWYQTPEVLTSSPRLPAWYIDGLELTVAATSPAFIEVATGICRDTANTINMRVSTTLHRTVTALWVSAATGGGVGVTWAKAVNYHVFVIKTAASTFDIGFDSALTASNVLARASGTKYRRIGSLICATTAGTMRLIRQRGDEFLILNGCLNNATFQGIAASGAQSNVAVIVPGIPTGINVQARVHAWATDVNKFLFHDTGTAYSVSQFSEVYGSVASGQSPQDTYLWTSSGAAVLFSAFGGLAGAGVRFGAMSYRDERK